MKPQRSHPEHLEPDPGRREFYCPISLSNSWETKDMTIPELQNAIIKSTDRAQALQILLDFCGKFGINSNAPPEWWAKREKLVEAHRERAAVAGSDEWFRTNPSP